ncbi:hypothetical protein G3580_00610 [Nitrogeniibacter mangrovi]|uniref:PBP domain-containing protein n=1 Tax=Nitrogeniibacter mangrovi TaxID=2016596 RepID=A0A6C1AYQ1_9RHOO|nr:hypothetical protein [Nitrogeniibacter mangrovi]QID16253.1 hypothetical protein G3580_00610 [Nitrogeniibacter mangrovi]
MRRAALSRPLALRTLVCLAALLGTPARAGEPAAFAIIVGPEVPVHHLSLAEAARIFERKQTVWSDGHRIHPVNLPPADPTRRQFSLTVLGRPPEALGAYWRERYFHGVLPPHVLASENAVRMFVAGTPGAIGYVAACLPPPPLRAVLTVGALPDCKP